MVTAWCRYWVGSRDYAAVFGCRVFFGGRLNFHKGNAGEIKYRHSIELNPDRHGDVYYQSAATEMALDGLIILDNTGSASLVCV